MQKAIEKIYANRQDFVLVALTGKIGAGCTTVADFMSQNQEQHNLPTLTFNTDITDSDRKKVIINQFYKKKWRPFTKITVSDVMTYMLLKAGLEEFKKLIEECKEEDFNDSFLSENSELNEGFEVLYSDFSEDVSDICLEKDDYSNFLRLVDNTYIFIVDKLPNISRKIKNLLKAKDHRLYTKVYQKLGDNLRTFGNPSNGVVAAKNIYSISNVVNNFIKVIRAKNKKDKSVSYIVIDSLRNPIEIMFFKERYSAFYLFSINASDSDIRSRLSDNLNMSVSQMKEQSEKENPDDMLKDMRGFVSQNIRDCVQKADVHIFNNGNSQNNNKHELYGQILKFVALIQHPGLVTPSNDEKMMQIAYTAKLNSGCLSRQVGAAVTNQYGSLVSIGWNSVAEGQTPCLLRNKHELISVTRSTSYSDFERSEEFIAMLKKHTSSLNVGSQSSTGLNHSFCFKSVYNKHLNDKNQVHTRSLHAEENAFLQIAKYGGESIRGGTLYTTASPCELCSKKAYQLGIKRVVYVDPYPGIAKKQILNSGLNRPEMVLFRGAIGSAYHRMYEQIIPYKDELDASSTNSCCG